MDNLSNKAENESKVLKDQDVTSEIFKDLADSQLKPREMVFEGFLKIPEVEKFRNALLDRQVSKEFRYIL